MNHIRITTTQNIELEYELASVGDRILGFILDALIQVAYLIVMISIFSSTGIVDNSFFLIVIILPFIFYDLASEVFMNGQSVGKRAMKIKVISLQGTEPTLGQYLIRWVFRMIDFTITYCLCGLISVAVSQKKQRVGDMVAGTTLIKTVSKTAFHETMYVPTEQPDFRVTFPEVSNLSDADMQLIKEVQNVVRRTGNSMLAYQAAVKIKETLSIESDMEPMHFLQTVLADYNYATSRL